MGENENLKLSLFAVMFTALLGVGCQSNHAATSVRYDNFKFMDLWNTYMHCLSAQQIQPAVLDSTRLHEVSQSQAHSSKLNPFLPIQLKSIMAQPSSRLAVDVQAMAASCSLHIANLAVSVGEHDLARNQFQRILVDHTQSDHSYYATQARTRLSDLERNLQASLR